ncbi:MAG TPA: ABC transporter substrate-binding protein [Methylomirabilota bacterium]|jgi:phospholipid transport system substrate-binding protein
MNWRRRFALPIIALVVSLPAAVVVRAGTPADQLRSQLERVLAVVSNTTEHSPVRREALRALRAEIFDLEEMSRRSLGRHGQGRTPEEVAAFTELFSDFLERVYVTKLTRAKDARIVIVGDSVEGDRATVRTRVAISSSAETAVDYRLLRRGERWIVYDVVVENVSLVNSYRAQFEKIMRNGGYPALVQRLQSPAEADAR